MSHKIIYNKVILTTPDLGHESPLAPSKGEALMHYPSRTNLSRLSTTTLSLMEASRKQLCTGKRTSHSLLPKLVKDDRPSLPNSKKQVVRKLCSPPPQVTPTRSQEPDTYKCAGAGSTIPMPRIPKWNLL